MFGRDPIIPLTNLVCAKNRYLGTEEGLLDLDRLCECYALAAFNIKMARDQNPNLFKNPPTKEFKVGDMVLLCHHDATVWDPKYEPFYRITKILTDRQVKLASSKGYQRRANIADIHFQYPVNEVICNLPDQQSFG